MTIPITTQQQIFNIISAITGQNNIIPLPIQFIRFVGDYHTAAILNQLIYWQGKGTDPDGWIYKTYDQWDKELAISKYQASRAAKTLVKMGILETKVKKINLGDGMFGNTAVHYKFDEACFVDLFSKYLESVRSKETSLPGVEKLHTQTFSNLTSLPYNRDYIQKNDDVRPAPPQPPPPPEPPTVPSSSLSIPDSKKGTHPPAPTPPVNFQSPIAFSPPAPDQPDMATAITALCLLLPDQFSKPSVKARLVQAIKQGHSIDTLKDTLQWCLKTTKATGYQSFKNYLGKTIDNGYAPENSEQEAMEDTVAVDKAAIQARLELPAGALKAMAETGDKYAIRALKIIKQE